MSEPEITLHHLNFSRSERLFWLLEELDLPYDVRVYFRLPTRGAPPELKEVSPFGKAPILELNSTVLSESGPIIHTLLTTFPSSTIESPPSQSSIFWSHFAEGSMMNLFQAGAIVAATSAGFARGMMGEVSEEEKKGVAKYSKMVMEGVLRPQNQNNLDQIEAFLAARPGMYFSETDKPGEGDFMMFFGLNSVLNGTRKGDGYNIGPALRKYWDMVSARPAVKKGMERLKKEEEGKKAKM